MRGSAAAGIFVGRGLLCCRCFNLVLPAKLIHVASIAQLHQWVYTDVEFLLFRRSYDSHKPANMSGDCRIGMVMSSSSASSRNHQRFLKCKDVLRPGRLWLVWHSLPCSRASCASCNDLWVADWQPKTTRCPISARQADQAEQLKLSCPRYRHSPVVQLQLQQLQAAMLGPLPAPFCPARAISCSGNGPFELV